MRPRVARTFANLAARTMGAPPSERRKLTGKGWKRTPLYAASLFSVAA